MIAAFRNRIDAFLGRGTHSTSVPVMDGPLQPNHALDHAELLLNADGVDNLVDLGGALGFSSGARLMHAAGGTAEELASFEADIACLASDGTGALAVGLDGAGIVLRGGAHDGQRIEALGGAKLLCPTAALFADPETLIVAVGSEEHARTEWKRDLMALGQSGSVWRVDLGSGSEDCLARGMGFPYGLAADGDGIVVSEAWRHRLVRLGKSGAGAVSPVLANLPGYPARLAPAHGSGYWMAVFAPRNQLVEFVLRETRFRQDMTAQVAPEFWIAPALSSGDSYREPLQGGAVKQMGILKPWAPVWSYGLVVRLDANFQPVASWHSRADGKRHGVTSVCEHGGRLAVAAKGPGELLLMDEVTITGEVV